MPTRQAIDNLKGDVVAMGEMCENALDTAIMALLDRDTDLACYVMDYDAEIDEIELAIDRQCVALMGSSELAEDDLRFVAAAAKITNDLERVGDLAVGISQHVLFLVRERSVLPQVIDFMDMANQVAQMMRESIQALLETDTTLAWKIIDENKIAEDEMQVIFRELLNIMQRDSRAIERCCHILFIVQFLLRVAEKATNVAEEVIYMSEGVMVRHHVRELHPVTHMPLDDHETKELQRVETELLESRPPRERVRKEHLEAKRKTKSITKEEVHAAAQSGRHKATKARDRILKLRGAR